MELMIAVVIVAIIVAIAIPAYNKYILKSRRSEGLQTLMAIQLAEEKYRTTNSAYGDLATVWGGTTTENGYYTLATSNVTASSYTITATAVGSQAGDRDGTTSCATLTLTYSNGTTTRTPIDCWD